MYLFLLAEVYYCWRGRGNTAGFDRARGRLGRGTTLDLEQDLVQDLVNGR